MKIAVVGLPRFPHLKRLIFEQLDATPHQYCILEESGREFIDGGYQLAGKPAELVTLPSYHEDDVFGLVVERGLDTVISFSDRGVVLAARVRERLGRPGNPVTVEQTVVDKAATRQRLLDAGLSNVPYRTSTLADLAEDVARIGLPAVVKPRSLGASICVELISSPEQLAGYLQRCLRNRVFRDGALIVEGYLPGPEVSVEGIVCDGTPYFYGVTESQHSGPPFFVGTGHDFFPAHDRAGQIYAYTAEVIAALGMRQCPFHIELKLLEDSTIEVIEAHTRFGGGMIMELVRHGTGAAAFAQYVGTLAGEPVAITQQEPLCCEQFLCVPSGNVAHIELGAELLGQPAVLSHALDLRAGDTVEPDVVPVEYAGYVSFRATDRADAERFRRLLDDNFRFDIR